MNSKKNLKRNLLICLLAGSAVMYTLPLHAATSVIANNTLPTGGSFVHGSGDITSSGLEMDIVQNGQNAVIKWDSFDIGGSATVNFSAEDAYANNFNTLNYINSGTASQIYGTINGSGGNIYIVNPAGVQIGNSAQINVGSLYVSSNTLSDAELSNFYNNAHTDNFTLGGTRNADIELMSLGNINASKVTFEGDGRIVIDSERLKDEAGNDKLGYQNINITTSDDNKDNIIIGYDAYDETITNGSVVGYANKNTDDAIATVTTENGTSEYTKAYGYMWVEDVEQLQAINTNLSGNYALRNSIDATSTATDTFISIGNHNNEFTGKFDGLDYSIFELNIDSSGKDYAGLFGVTDGAVINNVTIVGGNISGGSSVGAVVGYAKDTTISNVINSTSVTGDAEVGGIVGAATSSSITNAVNTGTVHSNGESDGQGGTVSNVGGLIGYMYNGTLNGNSYNLGDVSGDGYNVGGLVGHAVNSTIGDGTNLVYNRMDVTGAYNVGGIVGNMEGSTVQNAENSGTVEATGYTTEDYTYHTANTNFDNAYGENGDGIGGVKVNVANVGGIVGTSSASNGKASQIKNVTNTANVSSNTGTYNQYGTQNEYYTAGNVGGIVGRAEDTDITNATNQENEIRGAHNVGGVAGYFGGSGTVRDGINDGGDIMATGARAADGVTGDVVNDAGFAQEHVRTSTTGSETFIIGNMGGVVGYMDGDNVYVTGSANRGTVHSQEISNANNVLYTSQAANTGGVVGKIDRSATKTLEQIQNENDEYEAAVSDSYNTGDVTGYAGVGGVVGMMHNGEVASSYNEGAINTTRQPVSTSNRDTVNMGGVVGDTTEESKASAVIYDVYNSGQIGDETYTYYARHVGGIVGRLSGTVDKAYNTGNIYNGFSVVGGIAGWFYEGTISNAFNTGNITVYNNETNGAGSQVGGIAGGMAGYNTQSGVTNTISNAYNLGTLRSFTTNSGGSTNSIGGIVGKFVSGSTGNTNVVVENVYTTGNLYADDNNSGLGAIYGTATDLTTDRITIDNAYYITPENTRLFNNLSTNAENQGADVIAYANRYDKDNWTDFTFSSNGFTDGNVDDSGDWRIYDGTTPILNAFLPDSEKYFENGLKDNDGTFVGTIQYGTAYDPLLTIINTNRDLNFDFGSAKAGKLSITNAAGLVIYGGGLTLNDFTTSGGTGYFGGIIYSDGTLNIAGADGEDIGFGSGADIYGSSVNIDADGTITIYGDVTATGNTANGATKDENDTITVNDAGNITITSGEGDVNVYGTLTSAAINESTNIAGIAGSSIDSLNFGTVSDRFSEVTNMGERFAYTTGTSAVNGNITITANGVKDEEGNLVSGGNVGLYYGNKGEGITTTSGNLIITGTGDVYVDSDLDIGGNLTLNGTGADSEVVLDITNIGEVQEKNDNTDADDSTEYLHDFLNHFANNGNIVLTSASGDAKLAVDMWDETLNNNQGAYNLNKFNYNGQTFVNKLNNLNFDVNGVSQKGDASNFTYIWVSTAEQLQGIQDYYNAHKNDSDGTGALTYNYALKNDINASDLTDYEAIGTGATDGFTGTFDGRGKRIIGLDTTQTENGNDNQVLTNAGIFSTIGNDGTVKNLNVYSATFTGTDTAGTIAGVNNGTIENITAFGNTVTVTGNGGNAGGIAGTNSGTVDDVESSGSVIAEDDNAFVGGLVGTNKSGATVNNSYSNSAVTSTSGTDAGLGGVVGVNQGTVSLVDSLGVTNGTNSTKVGGVIGINSGTLSSAYNESIVNGYSNVGGIIGDNANTGTVSNIVNATGVTGEDESEDNVSQYVGGLVGTNSGSVTNGRNNGTITGTKYVGGMVGSNAQGATLTNLVNDSSAEILGVTYVGGIAGSNSGTITADEDNDNLVNRGSITGHTYVGGVAGVNTSTGIIANTNNSVVLNANEDVTGTAEYFGGVVGQNSGLIDGATNTSDIDITAVGGSYVGGIIGQNTESGKLEGEILNQGSVAGKSNIGGIIGLNENEKVLQGAASNRLTVTNEGNVTAEDGGAAGIFYANTGNISYADITNTGTVTGGSEPDSVTGGLFGTNSGEITNSTLTNTGIVTGGGTVGGLIGDNSGSATDSTFTNSGTVSGNTNVGGLFGTNSGKFETSSLINTVNAQVIGTQNVGGLIGTNTGIIIGGRNEAQETDEDGNVTAEKDSYYKYQVYNNGTITVTGSSSNIGGLIGENATGGSLTAGYNTGAINAENSSNVGGIAGSNSGTIDQVFNTVYNTDGTKGVITGDTNVGGLVGTNSGTLSNAYNTTDVSGNYVGNVVGVNNSSGSVSNVYDVTNINNTLIGSNNGTVSGSYTSAQNESSVDGTNGITYISSEKKFDKDSYTSLSNENVWKFYDGYSNPLLKVFLTDVEIKVDVDKINKYINNVYNGDAQYITDEDIDKLIAEGAITAPDNFTAYKNAKELINSISHTNAGTYNDWLYSGQIASSGTGETFNPNNLGYDIVLTADIDKATINISLDDIYRTYGDIDNIYSDADRTTGTTYGESYTIDTSNLNDVLQQYIKDNLQVELSSDGSLNGTDKTQNVDDYNWSLKFTLAGDDASNYQINSSDSVSDVVVTGENKAHIEKANLTITLDDVERVYGNIDFANSTGYAIESANLVNGDSGLGLDLSKITVSDDGALIIVNGETRTNNVDNYNWSVSNDVSNFTGVDNLGTNYNITVVAGDSNVTPKTITLADLVATIVYGNQDGKGFVLDSNSNLVLDGLVYGDNVTISGDAVYNVIEDSEYDKDRNGRDTADVGTYEDSLSVSGITLSGDKAGNYDLDTTAAVGDIEVTQATLNVTFNDVEHIYGNADLSNGTSYGVNDVTGIVNSDNEEDINNSLSFVFVDGSDTALTGSTGRVTNDVGTGYEYQGTVNTTNNNYKVVVNGTNSNTGIGKSEVTKATVQINLDDITHVYGQPSDDYKIKDDIIWVNGDAYSVNDIVITDNTVDDDAIDKTTGKTNNAGGQYKWNASVDASGNNAEIINKNYNFEVVEGNSYVDQAELTINLGDITHTYGEPNKNGYTFTANGWVYGEDYSGDISIGSLGSGITDNALKDNNEHTNNANTAANPYYTWTTNDYSISGEGAVNYKITVVNDGKSYVDKANLVITADDANTTIGNMPDRFTGTDIQEQLVNGDIISDNIYHYGVSADTDVNVVGEHNIGIYINGTYYELQNPDWSSENGLGFFANYNVTFEPGTLTVSAYDIPEDWPHNRWDYLFNDAPFDRNKDFRERKAEVNFVDGGMEI